MFFEWVLEKNVNFYVAYGFESGCRHGGVHIGLANFSRNRTQVESCEEDSEKSFFRETYFEDIPPCLKLRVKIVPGVMSRYTLVKAD